MLAGQHILYDAGRLTNTEAPGPEWFEPGWWGARSAVTGRAPGRGQTWFIRNGEAEYALRHYRRGGAVASLLGDRYLWTGLESTRPWREWRLLARLQELNLPAPAPVAARVRRDGPWARGDIITARIPGSRSLAAALKESVVSPGCWLEIGRTVRRFHEAGVDHADLNAHNILLNEHGVFLIDFDRGRIRRRFDKRGAARNLARLRRSLDKLGRIHRGFRFAGVDWERLMQGYERNADKAD